MRDVCNFGFLGRKNHIALQWKECILIFGGWGEKERPCVPSHVQVLCNGKWRCVKTTGRNFIAEEDVQDIPMAELLLLNPRTARVVGDKVYVMATKDGTDGSLIEKVCVLDLARWSWTDLTPKGNAPIMATSSTSWLHDDKIYVFGGRWKGDIGIAHALSYRTGHHENVYSGGKIATNQLFCYDTTTNTFEWPLNDILGPPRYGHSSFLHGNAVFIFGGLGADNMVNNELLVMDLETKKMKPIQADMTDNSIPWKRTFHSMTKTSTGKAILYGGFGSHEGSLKLGLALGDCWILHVERILSGKVTQPADLWSKVVTSGELEPRFAHSAIIEPQSERLYVFGGGLWGKDMHWMPSNKTRVVSFTTAPLELLAMERAVARYDAEDQNLEEFLPKGHAIRKTLEAKRQMGSLEHMVTISW